MHKKKQKTIVIIISYESQAKHGSGGFSKSYCLIVFIKFIIYVVEALFLLSYFAFPS